MQDAASLIAGSNAAADARRFQTLEERIRQLEKHIHYPHNEAALKSSAAQAQATRATELSDERIFEITKQADFGDIEAACRDFPADKQQALTRVRKLLALAQQTAPDSTKDTAPTMRSDVEAILTMTAFIKRLLSPEDFAYAVTLEVRNEARRALGFKEREV